LHYKVNGKKNIRLNHFTKIPPISTIHQLFAQFIEHKKKHDMWHGNPCPGLGQAQQMWWVKPFNGPTPKHSLLDNW
jgi:hypothetical protein